ncbi:hypothetical protein TNCV_4332791 [Trichonephila clavipes]|nr:hypothetical protein TNCV_4332791 [Trichonephila clavipes]
MSSFLVLSEGDTRNRWLDGQECPDVGQGIMVPWARQPGCVLVCYAQIGRGRQRDFGDLPIRRDEGHVVNTPLMFKRVLFQETRGKRRETWRFEGCCDEAPGSDKRLFFGGCWCEPLAAIRVFLGRVVEKRFPRRD